MPTVCRMGKWTLPWCFGIAALGPWKTVLVSAQVTYTVFPATPQAAAGQPTDGSSVTLDVRDSMVRWAVDAMTQQANVKVMYSRTPLLAARVNVRVVHAPLMKALATVLRGTGLVATMTPDGETVVVHPAGARSSGSARVMAGTIVGRVTDSASGQGVAGATVRVEGVEKLHTVTSDSGNFTLKDMPSGEQVLTVRLFGYKPASRTVTVVDSERTTVRVVLVPVPTVLSGVVTTAVGQQQRYQVGNDITVLNADSIQHVAPVSTLTQMLETRVPGLMVQHTDGIPGAPSRLRLRGLSSINNSADPILIIDGIRVYADQSGSVQPSAGSQNGAIQGGGVTTGGGSSVRGVAIGSAAINFAGPSALDQLDPNSIETIEVLKGPSATAIYGSDAANGVIVVTTKHGRPGPTRWTLSLDQGRTTLPGTWPKNWFQFCTDLTNPANRSGLCDPSQNNSGFDRGDSLVAFQALNDPRYSPLTGQPGEDRDASLTVSGGSGTLTYAVTGTATTSSGYLHLPPIELTRFQTFHGFPAPGWMRTPDQYTTYGATSTLTAQLGHRGGTLALTSSLFRSAQQQSSLQNDLTSLAQMYVDTSQLAANPLFPDYYTRAQLKTTTFTNAVSLNNWSPWPWLPLTAMAGLNVQNQDNNTLLPRDYVRCDQAVYDHGCASDSLGRFSIGQGTNTSGTLTVGTTLLQQRMVSTALGLNVYTLAQSGFAASTLGLPIGVSVPTSFIYNQGTGPSYSTVNSATYGWYVQPTVNLHSRFFVSPGFRLDGGSNSGTHGGVNGGALSLFPKLDFSWLAVERSPSDPLFGALTLLRPRIAVGVAGIQPGPGQQLRLLLPAQQQPLTSSGTGPPVDILQVSTLGNPHLHPERDREVEGGFDAQFWNQRLSLTLTSYRKMAYDAILSVPVAADVLPTNEGGGGFAENVGSIRNTGVEATLFVRLLDSRAVDWSVTTNLGQNRNLLVSLAPGLLPLDIVSGSTFGLPSSGYETRLVPGYPVFGLWTKPILGYYDANHDGRIGINEVIVGDSAVYVGAPQPNYELTVSTSLAFFNDRLSFTTSVDYENGLTQLMPNANLNLLLSNPTLPAAQQAAIAASSPNAFPGPSAIGLLQTVNTLRWNTLSVNYLVPPRVAHLVHVPTLSIALLGSNLGLHSSYRGVDPNVNAFSAGNLTEDTGGLLPPPRLWRLRLTLGY